MATFLSPNEIIDDILKNHLTVAQIKEYKVISENDLITLHHSFGMWIRNHYELWNPDNPHIIEKHPDDVSQEIIEKMWKMINTLTKYK